MFEYIYIYIIVPDFNLQEILEELYYECIDNIILGFCFEIVDQIRDGVYLMLSHDEMFV